MLSEERIIRVLAEQDGSIPMSALAEKLGIGNTITLTHYLSSYMTKTVYWFKGGADYVMLSPHGWKRFASYDKE